MGAGARGMATAATTNRGTNGDQGPAGRRATGRQLGGPAQRRPAAPARAEAALYPRPGRMGPLLVIRLIFLEAAVALVAVPVVGHMKTLITCLPC